MLKNSLLFTQESSLNIKQADFYKKMLLLYEKVFLMIVHVFHFSRVLKFPNGISIFDWSKLWIWLFFTCFHTRSCVSIFIDFWYTVMSIIQNIKLKLKLISRRNKIYSVYQKNGNKNCFVIITAYYLANSYQIIIILISQETLSFCLSNNVFFE